MKSKSIRSTLLSLIGLLALISGSFTWVTPAVTVRAADTPNPASVTITGSLQSELGCAGDWDPACAATHLVYDGDDFMHRFR